MTTTTITITTATVMMGDRKAMSAEMAGIQDDGGGMIDSGQK